MSSELNNIIPAIFSREILVELLSIRLGGCERSGPFVLLLARNCRGRATQSPGMASVRDGREISHTSDC